MQYAPGVATVRAGRQPDQRLSFFAGRGDGGISRFARGNHHVSCDRSRSDEARLCDEAYAPTDTSAVTVTAPTVSVGGKAATVVASFMAPNSPGFYGVMFTVPAGLSNGNQNISVSIGGLTSGVALLPVSSWPVVATVSNAASNNDPALPNE